MNIKKNSKTNWKKLLLINLASLIIIAVIILIIGEIYLRINHKVRSESVSAVGIPIYQATENNIWAHIPNTTVQNGYGTPTPTITINNLGLRNTKNFTPQTTQNNILMIGDSFTFGTGVNDDKTFTAILQQQINQSPEFQKQNWTVFNAGIIGHSIDNYLLTLKKLAPKIQPKLVIINIFVANDITEMRRHQWELNSQNQLTKVTDTEVFVNEQKQLSSWKRKEPISYFLDFLTKRIAVLKSKYAKMNYQKPTLTWPVFLPENHPGYDPRLPKLWSQFFTALNQIQDYSQENNINLAINIIPMDTQVSKHYWQKYGILHFDNEAFTAKRPQTKILNHCQNNNLTCLDLLPHLQAHPQKNQLYYQNADPHFDILGNQVTGEILFQQIFLPFANKSPKTFAE